MFRTFALFYFLFFSLSSEYLLALDIATLFKQDRNGIYEIEFIVANYNSTNFCALLTDSQLPAIIKKALELQLFHVAQILENCAKIQIRLSVRQHSN